MAIIRAEHKRIREARTAREAQAMAGKQSQIEHYFEVEIMDVITLERVLLNVLVSSLPPGLKVGDQVSLTLLPFASGPPDESIPMYGVGGPESQLVKSQ